MKQNKGLDRLLELVSLENAECFLEGYGIYSPFWRYVKTILKNLPYSATQRELYKLTGSAKPNTVVATENPNNTQLAINN